MITALTRQVSPALEHCLLTHLDRTPIDVQRAVDQHDAYCSLLHSLGCSVIELPAAPDCPDCVFIEDTLVVVDELAVLTRPAAVTRQNELPVVEEAISELRSIARIEGSGTLEGGDVLRVGDRLYVGRTSRTNDDGIIQLAELLRPFGYEVRAVDLRDCLHLKSAVTAVADDRIILNPEWVDPGVFESMDVIEIDPAEPMSANVLRIADALVMSDASPRTQARLEAAGLDVHTVDVSELAKAEGGVTCCCVEV